MNDLLKKAMCPTTKLPGWWWKKHFAYYRSIKSVMDTILLRDWMNGGYERHMQHMREAIDANAFSVFDAGFKTSYLDTFGSKIEMGIDIGHKDGDKTVYGDGLKIMQKPFIIVPSPRIDYCGACKKDHGYDCPLDEQICRHCGNKSIMTDECHIHGTPECSYCGECQFKEPYGDERDNA